MKDRHALRSACGKLSWIVRGTRPDLAFREAVLQHAYNDADMKVRMILEHNKLVNDAKRDVFDIIYYPIDVSKAGVVAMGDASYANVGKNKTESQADWVLMLVETTATSSSRHAKDERP